ncbi:hypothetical protein TNCT_569221, partial [Trichonephila clavata]
CGGCGVLPSRDDISRRNKPTEELRETEETRIRRLKEGVSETKILQDIREEITVDSGRKMLIEKKNIHNIKRDFNMTQEMDSRNEK